MKNILIGFGLIVSLGIAGWMGYVKAHGSGPANAWEYQEVQLASDTLVTAKLNGLGDKGWELVGVSNICYGENGCRVVAYLKRPR